MDAYDVDVKEREPEARVFPISSHFRRRMKAYEDNYPFGMQVLRYEGGISDDSNVDDLTEADEGQYQLEL